MYCRNCGAEVEENQAYCEQCDKANKEVEAHMASIKGRLPKPARGRSKTTNFLLKEVDAHMASIKDRLPKPVRGRPKTTIFLLLVASVYFLFFHNYYYKGISNYTIEVEPAFYDTLGDRKAPDSKLLVMHDKLLDDSNKDGIPISEGSGITVYAVGSSMEYKYVWLLDPYTNKIYKIVSDELFDSEIQIGQTLDLPIAAGVNIRPKLVAGIGTPEERAIEVLRGSTTTNYEEQMKEDAYRAIRDKNADTVRCNYDIYLITGRRVSSCVLIDQIEVDVPVEYIKLVSKKTEKHSRVQTYTVDQVRKKLIMYN